MRDTRSILFRMDKVKNGYIARFGGDFSGLPGDELVATTKPELRKAVLDEVTRLVDERLLSEKMD